MEDSAARMVVWFRSSLDIFGMGQEIPTIALENGEGKFISSEHISISYHHLNNMVKKKDIRFRYIKT